MKGLVSISKKGVVKIPHLVLPSLRSWKEQIEQTKMVWISHANKRKAREHYFSCLLKDQNLEKATLLILIKLILFSLQCLINEGVQQSCEVYVSRPGWVS